MNVLHIVLGHGPDAACALGARLQDICTAAKGDIRMAINTAQLRCTVSRAHPAADAVSSTTGLGMQSLRYNGYLYPTSAHCEQLEEEGGSLFSAMSVLAAAEACLRQCCAADTQPTAAAAQPAGGAPAAQAQASSTPLQADVSPDDLVKAEQQQQHVSSAGDCPLACLVQAAAVGGGGRMLQLHVPHAAAAACAYGAAMQAGHGVVGTGEAGRACEGEAACAGSRTVSVPAAEAAMQDADATAAAVGAQAVDPACAAAACCREEGAAGGNGVSIRAAARSAAWMHHWDACEAWRQQPLVER